MRRAKVTRSPTDWNSASDIPKANVGATGIAISVASILAIAASLGPLPQFILSGDTANWDAITPLQRFETEAVLRTQLLQAIAGMLIIVGALTALRQLHLARQQAAFERSAKYVDAFTRAIDLLVGQSQSSRVAGAYALWRLGRLEPGQRPTIVAILCSFVRTATDPDSAGACEVAVAAAADLREEGTTLDLSGAQMLKGKSLRGLDLRDVRFDHCDLRETNLCEANLSRCSFSDTDLSRADIRAADLRGSNFSYARVAGLLKDPSISLPFETDEV